MECHNKIAQPINKLKLCQLSDKCKKLIVIILSTFRTVNSISSVPTKVKYAETFPPERPNDLLLE